MASGSKILTAYLGLTHVLHPIYRYAVQRRRAAGKEHKTRFPERFGQTTIAKPAGQLIWIHAASVGETQSLLGLIPALLEERPDLSILLTSGTVTSARLMERDLPDRAIHQFAPIDTPKAIKRFLDHWQPDLAIWVESEIWPRMLVETKSRDIPMLLLNARVSAKTLERWTFARRAAERLFSLFDHILVQDQATNELLSGLGISENKRSLTGSLKSELAPAMPTGSDVTKIMSALHARRCWLAASTHRGEDELILEAHKALATNALLVLVPRHPERGTEITEMAKFEGFNVATRSTADPLTDQTEVYIADTLGELGLWYRCAPVSFVGGSLTGVGGHNPFEPLLLGSNVVTGPHTGNFADVYSVLAAAKGYQVVHNSDELSEHVDRLMDRAQGEDLLKRAQAALKNDTSVTASVRDAVLSWLR
ncbi:MAG: 3-deoxy-D-manno-octulosonic acid transferase [Cognatishimia sp.]|uniref:3-deoxy-D-manno-octulosonic acid transferase n=1 Tax=Cognatishimia sp. TaxID=2211648 RepID=UPI003B8C7970